VGLGAVTDPVDAPVQDRGEARSNLRDFPGARVVSVRSSGVASWDFNKNPYIDSIDEIKVQAMLGAGLRKLTGADSISRAWKMTFRTYRPGDKFAIKPNFNDLHDGIKGMITSPAVLNAVIEGLISSLGAEATDITIYDLTRTIPDDIRARINRPVNFVEPYGSSFAKKLEYRAFGFPLAKADPNAPINMTKKVVDSSGNSVKCYIPMVLTSVQQIINMPLCIKFRGP